MTIKIPTALKCICLILLLSTPCPADDISDAEVNIRQGDFYFSKNLLFQAISEYREAAVRDPRNPEVFRKMGLIYYKLGFLDDAAKAMQYAVSLSPGSVFPRTELGVIYFAKNDLASAREQFTEALSRNPSLSNAYYYLGEIFYRTREYDLAWLSLKASRCLGRNTEKLMAELRAVSADPGHDPCSYTGSDLYIRQILVDTAKKSDDVLMRLSRGELFEDIAQSEDRNGSVNPGGFLGRLLQSDIHPQIADELSGKSTFAPFSVVRTGAGVHIVQKISPFDIDAWMTLLGKHAVLSSRTNAHDTKKASFAPPDPPSVTAKKDHVPDVRPEQKTGPVEKRVESPVVQPARSLPEKKPFLHSDTVTAGRSPAPEVQGMKGRTSVMAGDDKGGTYIVYSGSFSDRIDAEIRLNDLVHLGYPSYIHMKKSGTKQITYDIVAGKYDSLKEAIQTADALAENGFDHRVKKED